MIHLSTEIPLYPHFVNLSIEHQNAVTKFTQNFPNYSDFNFAVMWWSNTNNDFEISNLNGNLVVLFKNFVTEHPVFSFLGINNVDDTVEGLIARSKTLGYCNFIQNIPDICLQKFKSYERFQVKADVDQFDYVYSTSELMNLSGRKFRHKRQIVQRFRQQYPQSYLKIRRELTVKDLEDLFATSNKWKGSCPEKHEVSECIERLLLYRNQFHLEIASVHLNQQMIAFQIYELIGDHAIAHFRNSDPNFPDAATYLTKEHAGHLNSKGFLFINRMQDLGIPNLRKAKSLWRPSHFLKKYTIHGGS